MKCWSLRKGLVEDNDVQIFVAEGGFWGDDQQMKDYAEGFW